MKKEKLNKLSRKVFENCPPGVYWAGVKEDGEGVYFYTKNKPAIENRHWFISNWTDWSYIPDSAGDIMQFDASDWENSVIYRWPRKKKVNKIEKKEPIKKPYKPEILFLVFLFSVIVILICYFLMKMNLFNPFDI